ncbi:hypothetical protein AMECASPLE_018549 [Ameca splendens]|uniref:Uncharacterized protein n=1 Tax=Ameca splendens TaxID=208324 RepID=A0ABV0XFT2_9TELE
MMVPSEHKQNFGLNPLNSVVTDRVEVHGAPDVNGMLVLQTYANNQLQLGLIASIVVKEETDALLFLRKQPVKWEPELGVYEMERNSLGNLVCENLKMLSDSTPLCFHHRGVRLLHPLKMEHVEESIQKALPSLRSDLVESLMFRLEMIGVNC